MSNQQATKFKFSTTPSGKKAFEAWCALWTDFTVEMALCAPTIDELKKKWNDMFPNLELDIARVQHIWIVAFSTLDDAPATTHIRGAQVACSRKNCKDTASFIVRGEALCLLHWRETR